MVRIVVLLIILPWWLLYAFRHLLHFSLIVSFTFTFTLNLFYLSSLWWCLLVKTCSLLFTELDFFLFILFELFCTFIKGILYILKFYFYVTLINNILFSTIFLLLCVLFHPFWWQIWQIFPFYTYLFSFYPSTFTFWPLTIKCLTQFVILEIEIIY